MTEDDEQRATENRRVLKEFDEGASPIEDEGAVKGREWAEKASSTEEGRKRLQAIKDTSSANNPAVERYLAEWGIRRPDQQPDAFIRGFWTAVKKFLSEQPRNS